VSSSLPFSVPLQGGLNKSTNSLALLRTPGVATKLRNFEVSIEGGYRRINGYTVFGGGSAVRPNTSEDIEGLSVYADGVVVVAGNDIFFSQDGTSYLQLNKASVSGSGDNFSTFSGRSELSLTSIDQCEFALFEGTSDYGELVITDKSGNNKPFLFKMTGTGTALSSRTYFASQITISGSTTAKFCTIHDNHLVVAGDPTTPNTIYYSATGDIDSFSGTGSGSITLEDKVVGLKSFRNELFIFCRNSIFKLQNINNSSTIAVVPITKDVGCVDGKTIQEIAGDLIFLAPDGFRTVAGTARIGDVELGTISQAIQPIINDILKTEDLQFNSVIIRDKSQYRMFYSADTESTAGSKGIIGTLRPNGFEWSETLGIQAPAITSGFNSSGLEKFYHGDRDGYIYNHDTGNSFNPAGTSTNVEAEYQSPDFDYGDLGTLKTLDYAKFSFTPEGECQPTLRYKFDYDSNTVPQPVDILLDSIPEPAIFGAATFGSLKFGAAQQPLVRQTLTGSGHSNFFRIFSADTNAPYAINGLYITYRPSGRQ
tara:strand:+ start:105 stop:1721 length:1617 start_codon:yes stop_codon:yes gene_type:complete